ncbi:hypothetical protein ON010_g12556 [Phytophthora cinnamomi]|nr:hypothetical protein ON010_g12556 [Phytophthora cinnamomi]
MGEARAVPVLRLRRRHGAFGEQPARHARAQGPAPGGAAAQECPGHAREGRGAPRSAGATAVGGVRGRRLRAGGLLPLAAAAVQHPAGQTPRHRRQRHEGARGRSAGDHGGLRQGRRALDDPAIRPGVPELLRGVRPVTGLEQSWLAIARLARTLCTRIVLQAAQARTFLTKYTLHLRDSLLSTERLA